MQEPIAASLTDEAIAAMISAPRSSRSSARPPAPKAKPINKSARSASERENIYRKGEVNVGRSTRASANESQENKDKGTDNPRVTRYNPPVKKVEKKASQKKGKEKSTK